MALTKEFWQDLDRMYPGWGDPTKLADELDGERGNNYARVFGYDRDQPRIQTSSHCCGVAEIGQLASCASDFLILRICTQLAESLGRKKSRIFYYAPPGAQANFYEIRSLLMKYGFKETEAFYNANSGNEVVGFVNDIGALRWYTNGLYSPQR